jgi:hypothetical protein
MAVGGNMSGLALGAIASGLLASIAFACAIAVFAVAGLLIGAKYAPRS